MLKSDLIFIFLIVPLVTYAVSKATSYKLLFGLFESEGKKSRAFLCLGFSAILFLLFPMSILFGAQWLNTTVFIALIYGLHLLYLYLECFDSKKIRSININYALLMFLSLEIVGAFQYRYLLLVLGLIIILNHQERPTRLVDYIFLSYEALILTSFMATAFYGDNILMNSMTYIGLFALLLFVSQNVIRTKIFYNLAKLSCMVFIIFILYQSSRAQWDYWF